MRCYEQLFEVRKIMMCSIKAKDQIVVPISQAADCFAHEKVQPIDLVRARRILRANADQLAVVQVPGLIQDACRSGKEKLRLSWTDPLMLRIVEYLILAINEFDLRFWHCRLVTSSLC